MNLLSMFCSIFSDKPKVPIVLLPIGHLQVDCISLGIIDDWMVSRKYLKNNEEIWVKGFGRDKQEAIENFNQEFVNEGRYL